MSSSAPEDSERGALRLSLVGDFRGRTQLTKLARQAVIGLLVEAGCDREAQSAGMIVAQELAENLVKYGRSVHTSFAVTVNVQESQHVRIELETANDATEEEIARVLALLNEVDLRADPNAVYQEHIASSATRTRSELGLLRILAEAAMALSVRVESGRIHLRAESGHLNVANSMNAEFKGAGSIRPRESIR